MVIVSIVVKVFEQTMKSVVSSGTRFSVSPRSAPSTLDTVCKAQMARDEGREHARGHGGTEIRAADADVHNVGKSRAIRRLDVAVADRLREGFHLGPLGQNLRHDILTFGEHGLSRKIAQSHVQRRTMLRRVDRLAGKERRPPRFDTGGACEIDRAAGASFLVGPMFREVEQKIVEFDVKALKPLWIVGETDRRSFARLSTALCASSAARALQLRDAAMRHLQSRSDAGKPTEIDRQQCKAGAGPSADKKSLQVFRLDRGPGQFREPGTVIHGPWLSFHLQFALTLRLRSSQDIASWIVSALAVIGNVETFEFGLFRHPEANDQVDELVKNGRPYTGPEKSEQHGLHLDQHLRFHVVLARRGKAGLQRIVGETDAAEVGRDQNAGADRPDDAADAMDAEDIEGIVIA